MGPHTSPMSQFTVALRAIMLNLMTVTRSRHSTSRDKDARDTHEHSMPWSWETMRRAFNLNKNTTAGNQVQCRASTSSRGLSHTQTYKKIAEIKLTTASMSPDVRVRILWRDGDWIITWRPRYSRRRQYYNNNGGSKRSSSPRRFAVEYDRR